MNPANNKPKGFAFVEFKSKNSALKTIKELNEKVFRGRKLQATMALDQRLYQNEKEREGNTTNEKEDGDTNSQSHEEKEDEENDIEAEESLEENGQETTKNNKNNNLSNPNKDKGVVFVKNINYDVNADDFTEHFKNFDKIAWAKVK